jgi:hypothetical protein
LLASAPERYYNCAVRQVQIVLSDDVYCNMVYRANLLSDRNLLPGIDRRGTFSIALFSGFLTNFFVRIHDEDRGPRFCGKFLLPDPYVVIRSALRGEFVYLHEPLVYTRTHAESQTSKMVRVKDASMLVAHLRLVKEFGRSCWDEADYKRVIDLNVGRLARFVLRWGISGQWEAARVMSGQLAGEGFRLKWGDYVRYAIGWPVYAIRKHSTRTEIGPHVDEHAFEGAICDMVAGHHPANCKT